MSPDTRPNKPSYVLTQHAADTILLLNPESGRYYSLEGVGAEVWSLADGTRTPDEIIDTLAREYDAPREQIAADVHELLGELTAEKLLSAAAADA